MRAQAILVRRFQNVLMDYSGQNRSSLNIATSHAVDYIGRLVEVIGNRKAKTQQSLLCYSTIDLMQIWRLLISIN